VSIKDGPIQASGVRCKELNKDLLIRPNILFCIILFCILVQFDAKNAHPRKPYWWGSLSTVDLLVITAFDNANI
jgi:hypothetical protein